MASPVDYANDNKPAGTPMPSMANAGNVKRGSGRD
jgi:hypothetical protein